jgi:hypothetical protein
MNFVVNTCLGCVWQRHFTPTKTMELGVAPPFFLSRSAVDLLELGVFG